MRTPTLHTAARAAAAVVLVAGSAYVGATVAKNSVGSPQVKNDSLTTDDIRDGTIHSKDLAAQAAPRTFSFIGDIPTGTTKRIIDIPGFSRFDATCGSSTSIFAGFGDSTPEPTDPRQQHGIALSDISDANPVGAATITGFGGGVGFTNAGGSQPTAGVITRGDYWGRADKLLAHGTISLGYPGATCLVRVQVVVQRLPRAKPIPRPRVVGSAAGTCESTGDAYCVTEPN